MRMGKFVLFRDKANEWRFNLQASNGKVIAVSEGYRTKSGAMSGMYSIADTIARMAGQDYSSANLIVEERV